VVASLRPGGVFLLEAYTPDQIGRGTGGPPVAELTMTLESLREELVGLEIHHGVELLRDVVEGSGHTGTAAVVQLVAVKPGR
jgi:CobQ-like glutamine amidotransferase family enzyme